MSKFNDYLKKAEEEDLFVEELDDEGVPEEGSEPIAEDAANVTQVEFFGNKVKGSVNGKPFIDTIMSFQAKRPTDWAAIEKALSNAGVGIEAFVKDDKTNIDFSIVNGVAKIVDVGELNAYKGDQGTQPAAKPNPAQQQMAMKKTADYQKAGEQVIPAGKSAGFTRKQ